jgi:hypothetical protein
VPLWENARKLCRKATMIMKELWGGSNKKDCSLLRKELIKKPEKESSPPLSHHADAKQWWSKSTAKQILLPRVNFLSNLLTSLETDSLIVNNLLTLRTFLKKKLRTSSLRFLNAQKQEIFSQKIRK